LGLRIGCAHLDIDKLTVQGQRNQHSIPRKHRKNFVLERAAGCEIVHDIAATQVDAALGLDYPETAGRRLLSQSDGHGCRWFSATRTAYSRRLMSNQVAPFNFNTKNTSSSRSRACQIAPPVPARGAFRLDRDIDFQAEQRLHRHRDRVIGDLLRCVTGEQQNTSDAVSAELEQQCVEEGSAPYFKQRFWFFLSNRACRVSRPPHKIAACLIIPVE
jgi:hypothetical protein